MPIPEAKTWIGSPSKFEWWVGLSDPPTPREKENPQKSNDSAESTKSTTPIDKPAPPRRYIGKRPKHEKWPIEIEGKDPPILYAHFLIERAVIDAPKRFIFSDVSPKLTPDMLIYLGERSNVSNFRYGPWHYPWLDHIQNSLIYSLYWPIWNGKADEHGGTLDWRRTLESQIYFALKAKYHLEGDIFQYVSGLQFRHRFMRDKDLIECRDFIVNDLSNRFASQSG